MVLTPRRYQLLLGLIGLLLLGLWSQSNHWITPNPPVSSPLQACTNLQQGCQLHLSDGEIATIQMDSIPQPLKPFTLTITTHRAYQGLAVSFAMINMEMGFNRYPLTSTDQRHWRTTITLPVCTAGRADWRMTLIADQAHAALAFTSER